MRATSLTICWTITLSLLRGLRGEPRRVLLASLSDPDPGRRRWAAWALSQLSASAPEDAELAQALIGGLADEEAEVRKDVAWGLKRMGVGAVRPLIGALGDPRPQVRRKAALLLHLARGQAAVAAALRERLGDADREVRRAAALALLRRSPARVPARRRKASRRRGAKARAQARPRPRPARPVRPRSRRRPLRRGLSPRGSSPLWAPPCTA